MFFAIVLAAAPAEKLQFNRDVRPILSDACFACHGPDKAKRKGGLRLDLRDAAVEKGALIPGKPTESEVIARLKLPLNDEQHMPPKHAHKELTAKQITTLETWIAQGAEYQPFWAYIPPAKSQVPNLKSKVGTEIDAFLAAELENRGLRFSPEADRRTLIRRLSLDLIGLPPTPAEVEAFVTDAAPNAYEKVVDRLLASPHYGERMATPWLDLVRFADTVGYHGDQNQRIFPYRDYVIDAFNSNMPFDRFTREQLAADLLPNPTPQQLTATGFNRLNMMTREGGAQPKEYLAKYQADRVRTVSMAWLGSTMGCAECHDHKYDPFTAKDFYSMSAFFADIRQWGVYSDYGYTPNPDLKGWSNDHPFPPEVEVESAYLKARTAALQKIVLELGAGLPLTTDNQRLAYTDWLAAVRAYIGRYPSGWQPAEPYTFTGTIRKDDKHTFTLPTALGRVAAVRVELQPTAGGKITRDSRPASVTLTLRRKTAGGESEKVPLAFGGAVPFEAAIKFSSTVPVTGLPGGAWRTDGSATGRKHTAVWLLEQPLALYPGEELLAEVEGANLATVAVAASPSGPVDVRAADVADREWIDAAVPNNVILSHYLFSTAADKALFEQSKKLRRELLDLRGGRAWTQVTVSQSPVTTRLLPRGNWMDETGPVLDPATPGFLNGPKSEPGKRLTRLDLANWITAKDNPLTARTFVNRLWKQFFGTGLSGNPEDLGGQGETPSHPDLLDFLAVEFAADWDVKKAVKRIVMTAAYRQQSKARPEVREFDPGNRLLSFHPPRRLEAEFVRDNALAVAGLLNRDVGGPSSKPYQPDGYYANLQFPDRKYVAAADRTQYRRGLYTHWQRTFLHPMLANFDAPSREECTANRPNANTPQQALTLLNDPTFVEAARVLAAEVVKTSDDDKRLSLLFQKVLSREPAAAERTALAKFLTAQKAHFAANPSDAAKVLKVGLTPAPAAVPAADLAAWTAVCRAVLNLHETITRY